jgi:cell fate regulator YaaT (PSP1 superfamily)
MVRIAEVSPYRGQSASCGGDPNDRCGNGLEKIYPTTVVRYGYMRHLGEFAYNPGQKFSCGGKVIIETDRGIELGEQVSLTCTGCSKSVSREQVRSYVRLSGEKYLDVNRGKILREATASDLQEQHHIREEARGKLTRCRRLAGEMGLPMKLVECEHLFGGERIIFYFMAEGRVDFRELVKSLAKEMHTRIEMRQIGARDEARLVADYETCGRECCCKAFLKTLKPISMRMAKLQKATLDPSKVSGRCGRLKCCLRYEHETYEELERKLPRLGKKIRTAHGEGVVVARQPLTQLVQIELENGQRFTVVVEDILPGDSGPAAAAEPAEAPPDAPPGGARDGVAEDPDRPSPLSPESAAGSPGAPDAEPGGGEKKRRRRRRRRGRGPGAPGQEPGDRPAPPPGDVVE